MRALMASVVAVAVVVASMDHARAAAPYVYPAKGQSAAQQGKDGAECEAWARSQTGVDPAAPPPSAGAGQHARGTAGGAARGAAGGAALGAIAGDAGKGAAAGAVVGGVRGRRGSKQAQQAQAQDSRSAYDRAFAACMEGRGYTVK